MSYEGHVEFLCANGHRWVEGAYDEPDEPKCPDCGGAKVWRHAIDQTNGVCYCEDGSEDPSTVPYPLEVDHYEERLVKVAIYRIPENGE